MSTTDAPYAFGRQERRGTVLGWRPGQALAVALGALGLVAGAGTQRVAGVLAGVLCALVGLAIAAVPRAGRGLDEWVPVAAAFLVRARRGALCAGASVEGTEEVAHLRWPDGRCTVIAEVRHAGLRALSDAPRAHGESVSSWLRALGGVGASRGTAAFLTVAGRARSPNDAPWVRPVARVATYVAFTSAATVDLAAQLGLAGVRGVRPLGASAIESLLGDRAAPAPTSLLACDMAARWRHLEGPASLHVSFTIEEWPPGPVDEQVLAPLLVSKDRRTVSIHVKVEELHVARERAARARTGSAADRRLAGAAGFLAAAESVRDDEREAARAAELAAGHASLRVLAAIAVDAAEPASLEDACARLLADAARCGVRLRRCDGDHRRGVLSSVPGWCEP